MFLSSLGIGIFGIFCGLMVSGGVFTALLALGLVPRFAGKTHTAQKVLTYESAVVTGCITGGLFSVFEVPQWLENGLYRLWFFQSEAWIWLADGIMAGGGFFAGCFIGCVALAIAEMLDSIPIFARRIRFRKGLGVAVLAVAIGKTIGSLLYFAMEVYR